MKSKTMLTITAAATVALAILGGAAASVPDDKYTLKVPGGLAFSEFRGYEDWPVVPFTAPKTCSR